MKHRRKIVRAALLLAVFIVLLAVPAVSSAATTSSGKAATGAGWIRLAHLSPNTPAVDVYLYSFGNPDARIVLRHVAYGDSSGYLAVPKGEYSVAMRAAGAAATSPPVLSASTRISSGAAYTALAVGPESGLRLRVFRDDLTTPKGKALVRVVQSSMKHPKVTVTWDGRTIESKLPFAAITSYQAVSPGAQSVAATGGAGSTKSAVRLTAGSIHTLVILDGARGLQISNLTDAEGSSQLPAGGAQTGFGGTAPRGPGSPLPWLEVIAGGAVLVAGGGLGLRRSQRRRRAGRTPGARTSLGRTPPGRAPPGLNPRDATGAAGVTWSSTTWRLVTRVPPSPCCAM